VDELAHSLVWLLRLTEDVNLVLPRVAINRGVSVSSIMSAYFLSVAAACSNKGECLFSWARVVAVLLLGVLSERNASV
jgi:hypothetical protein